MLEGPVLSTAVLPGKFVVHPAFPGVGPADLWNI